MNNTGYVDAGLEKFYQKSLSWIIFPYIDPLILYNLLLKLCE